MNNPFAYIGQSTRPAEGEAFIGRQRLLNELCTDLCGNTPHHLSLYGMPHVGKTSLLRRLRTMLQEIPTALTLPVVTVQYGSQKAEGEAIDNFTYNIRQILHRLARLDADATPIDKSGAEETNPKVLMQLLRQAITTISKGRRVILLLDEFERINGSETTPGWSQEAYMEFARLLMDDTLDFVCVTASRPRMRNILNGFSPAPNPFVSRLLHGFDDSEMQEFFDLLNRENTVLCGKPLNDAENHDQLQALLRLCGRSPYLLTMLGNELLINASKAVGEQRKSIRPLHQNRAEDFQAHFDEIINFMIREEEKKQRSFSHIVKCYFGQFADYQDIKERCIASGYLELAAQDSPYTYQGQLFPFDDIDDRFTVYDIDGNALGSAAKKTRGLVYTTVAPLFVEYLFTPRHANDSRSVPPLDLVNDPRDLLTGLIHTVRDITKERLSRKWGSDWNRQLAERYYTHSSQTCTRIFTDGQHYSYWKQVGSSYHYVGGNRGSVTPQQVTSEWQARETRELSGQSNPDVKISVDLTALLFVCEEFSRGCSTMPALDPINLNDQAKIVCTYWQDGFSNYFGALPNGENDLKAMMASLKKYRDRVSHFSRYGYTDQTVEQVKADCRKLISSIYYYRYFGTPCPPIQP